MDTSMPASRRIDTPPPVTRADMAARLDAILDIPVELFDGLPGETTSDRARGLLEGDRYLAVRARALMEKVMRGREPALDTVPIVVTSPGLTTDHVDRAA